MKNYQAIRVLEKAFPQKDRQSYKDNSSEYQRVITKWVNKIIKEYKETQGVIHLWSKEEEKKHE